MQRRPLARLLGGLWRGLVVTFFLVAAALAIPLPPQVRKPKILRKNEPTKVLKESRG
jgi:hypothetical protein